MATATLERTTTNTQPKPVEISQQAPAQPANREPRLIAPANIRALKSDIVGKTRKESLIRGWARALGDVSFQLGIFSPGRRWDRDSRQLSAKEKAGVDIRMHGFFY